MRNSWCISFGVRYYYVLFVQI